MQESIVTTLRQLAEPMAALSLAHLSLPTRQKLIANDLSVNVHPGSDGGFIYVEAPPHLIPAEPDLALVFEAAGRAGIVWLKFDSDSAIIDGLPVFEPGDEDL